MFGQDLSNVEYGGVKGFFNYFSFALLAFRTSESLRIFI
jgi:hypothetical protein